MLLPMLDVTVNLNVYQIIVIKDKSEFPLTRL